MMTFMLWSSRFGADPSAVGADLTAM